MTALAATLTHAIAFMLGMVVAGVVILWCCLLAAARPRIAAEDGGAPDSRSSASVDAPDAGPAGERPRLWGVRHVDATGERL